MEYQKMTSIDTLNKLKMPPMKHLDTKQWDMKEIKN